MLIDSCLLQAWLCYRLAGLANWGNNEEGRNNDNVCSQVPLRDQQPWSCVQLSLFPLESPSLGKSNTSQTLWKTPTLEFQQLLSLARLWRRHGQSKKLISIHAIPIGLRHSSRPDSPPPRGTLAFRPAPWKSSRTVDPEGRAKALPEVPVGSSHGVEQRSPSQAHHVWSHHVMHSPHLELPRCPC
jgi:hypothetical protein